MKVLKERLILIWKWTVDITILVAGAALVGVLILIFIKYTGRHHG